MIFYIVAILFTILAIPLVLIVASVDNWSRDLTTNVAETSPDTADPRMQPLSVGVSFDELTSAAKSIAKSNAGWEFVDASANADGGTLHMVHVTRLMKYRDDVTLTVQTTENETSVVNIRSASRIGKGDLGQNPRNIRALRELLTAELGVNDSL